MESSLITAVITSCGRLELLERTLSSLFKTIDLQFEKVIIIDNSEDSSIKYHIEKILNNVGATAEIIVNETNIGQISSIDKAYALVETDYIFHCEEDWEFFDTGYLSLSKQLLEDMPEIININLRVRFDNEIGAKHPISELMESRSGIKYHQYQFDYQGLWHGFSWNPGLRRLSDYKLIESYKKYKGEAGVGKKYKDMGYIAACLEKPYCRHIGTHSITPRSNK